jgi:hypothetical protein
MGETIASVWVGEENMIEKTYGYHDNTEINVARAHSRIQQKRGSVDERPQQPSVSLAQLTCS